MRRPQGPPYSGVEAGATPFPTTSDTAPGVYRWPRHSYFSHRIRRGLRFTPVLRAEGLCVTMPCGGTRPGEEVRDASHNSNRGGGDRRGIAPAAAPLISLRAASFPSQGGQARPSLLRCNMGLFSDDGFGPLLRYPVSYVTEPENAALPQKMGSTCRYPVAPSVRSVHTLGRYGR